MRNRLQQWGGVGLVAGLLLAAFGLRTEAAPFAVGESFPNLILPQAATGQPDSLAAYRGKKTVLHLFASW